MMRPDEELILYPLDLKIDVTVCEQLMFYESKAKRCVPCHTAYFLAYSECTWGKQKRVRKQK